MSSCPQKTTPHGSTAARDIARLQVESMIVDEWIQALVGERIPSSGDRHPPDKPPTREPNSAKIVVIAITVIGRMAHFWKSEPSSYEIHSQHGFVVFVLFAQPERQS